jgi:hypothetical protein
LPTVQEVSTTFALTRKRLPPARIPDGFREPDALIDRGKAGLWMLKRDNLNEINNRAPEIVTISSQIEGDNEICESQASKRVLSV